MEKRDDAAKEQGEDPDPRGKKASWVKTVRKPAYHPTAAGVKAQEENDKVKKKREKATKNVAKALEKVNNLKAAIH